MKKLSKTLRAFGQIAKNPWLLNRVLNDERHWQKYVIRKYGIDNGLPVVMPESLFGDFSETVSPYASLDGSSFPSDLALLKKFARGIADCSYFEIGTWRGESVANVAAVAKECYTLNLSSAQLRKIGMEEKYISQHRHFSSGMENVVHLEGDSRNYDFEALNKKFDLIFIDGDHHYEMVRNDTAKVFQSLFHSGSTVVWHDYAFNPEKIRFEVLAGILDGCPTEFHHQIYYVANSLCAIYINKKVNSKPFESPQKPEGYFEVDLRWKKDSQQ